MWGRCSDYGRTRARNRCCVKRQQVAARDARERQMTRSLSRLVVQSVNAPDCVRTRRRVITAELDMSEHITRHALQDAILPLATKRELEIWAGSLIGRMDAQFETVQLHMDAMQRNIESLQRDVQRSVDTLRSELQAVLTRLEQSERLPHGLSHR